MSFNNHISKLFTIMFAISGFIDLMNAELAASITSSSAEIKEQKLKKGPLCAHPVYPCFYFDCTKLIKDDKSSLRKCARGLIFDENVQRCTWALPWQRCNGNEENAVEFQKHSFFSPINKDILIAKVTTKITKLNTYPLQKVSSQPLFMPKATVTKIIPSPPPLDANITDEIVLQNLKTRLLQMQQRQADASSVNKPPVSPFIINHQSDLYNFISSSLAAKTSSAEPNPTTALKIIASTKKIAIKTPTTTSIRKSSVTRKSQIMSKKNSTNKKNHKSNIEKNNFSHLFLNNLNIESESLYDDFNITAINEKFVANGNLNKLKDEAQDDVGRGLTSQEENNSNSIEINEDDDYEENDDEKDEDDSEEDTENETFAYIIVPIKLNKNSQKSKQHKIETKKKIIKNKKAKYFEEMYKYKKVCYVTNWSQYREKPAQFLPENVDPFLCTHIIYAFAYIDNQTFKIKTIEENDEEMYKRINDLKIKNPKLKTMLGIGGWNMESKHFSDMVKSKENREKFISNAIEFLRSRGFDGIDLDWEFPADRGGVPDDKPNFTKLVRELRKAIDEEADDQNLDRLVLSAAVAAGKKRIDMGYEVNEMVKHLDFVNLMSFDYHGSWDPKTGLNAPLYSNENDTEESLEYNQDWSVSYWIKKGCPPHKIVLGLPAFGRTFTLMDNKENGISSKSFNNGTSGNYTKTPGFLSYYEICELKKKSQYKNVWISQSKSSYMFKNNEWISYDDIRSFHLRTAYVVAKKLGGIFIWSIDMDDFNGKFCGMGSYPLIKNSMSLLMEYMPEYYSSQSARSAKMPRKLNHLKANNNNSSSKIFYVLKDDQLSAINQKNLKKIENDELDESNISELNRIKSDLSSLLIQHPNKFASFNLPETFNCTNKQRGFHRDPFDCAKYYYCNENNGHINNNFSYKYSINNNSNLTNQNPYFGTLLKKNKTNANRLDVYTCPENSIFNMNGCFCDRNLLKLSNCQYLSDTFCNDRLFKGLNYQFI